MTAGASFVVEDQTAALSALADPRAYAALGPEAAGAVTRIDTHGSVVFLAGGRVVKVKRAVRFPYMDFGTLERRRAMCAAEIAVNRRVAPTLYLGVAPVVMTTAGATLGPVREPDAVVGDEADAVEWAVVMRRFDEAGLFSRLADSGALTADLVARLAASIARFHETAPSSDAHAGEAAYREALETDATQMRARGALLDQHATAVIERRMRALLEPLLPLVRRRQSAGAVRRVHGDLHLRNVCLVDGEPTPFDSIEFSDRIATIDVLYDLAFLLMDLSRRGLGRLANLALNHYLWRADGPAGAPNLEALALLPLWLARRACVRAFVDAAAAELAGDPANLARVGAVARAYQAAAVGFLEQAAPSLVAVGGLSGTGKTTLAMALAPDLGRAPGAIVVRTDVERKRISGVEWDAPLPPGHYTPQDSVRVYAEVMHRAETVLRAGQSAVVDAVFARPDERAAVERVARDAGVAFTGIWLEVPEAVAVSRIEARRGDASDATPAVARRQRGYDLGTMEWRRLDASRDPSAILADARRWIAASRAR